MFTLFFLFSQETCKNALVLDETAARAMQQPKNIEMSLLHEDLEEQGLPGLLRQLHRQLLPAQPLLQELRVQRQILVAEKDASDLTPQSPRQQTELEESRQSKGKRIKKQPH